MKKFNPSISFIRVIAMMSIIVGHVFVIYGINDYQLLAIGVEIFLFISGFLYGNYETLSWIRWVGCRWMRLVPPLWCTVGIYILICLGMKVSLMWTPIAIYVLNIQGAHNVFKAIELPTFQGLGQTWFVTVISLCYILMVIIKKTKIVEEWVDQHSRKALFFAVLGQILFCFIGIQLSYFLQFFVGFFISRKVNGNNCWVKKNNFLFVTVLMLMLVGIRLLANRTIDGTILYDMVIARLSFNVLAIWIIMAFVRISSITMIEKMIRGKGWKIIDFASYALFLTHYMFLQGPMKVNSWVPGTAAQILIFAILSVASCAVVLLVTERNKFVQLLKS